MKMNVILSAILFGLCLTGCSKNDNPNNPDQPNQNTTTITYQSSDDMFPNPERGFYKYSDNNKPLTESTLNSYRANNYTLLFRYFYLDNYRNSALPDQVLNQFDNDMSIIRNSGMKCIVRFAYSADPNESERDAPLNIVLQQLDQLKPYLVKNVDVIYVMQAGFVGTWGEWYYTTYFDGANYSGRYTVLQKILATLPTSRMIQVRTPNYKQTFIQRTTPLTQAEAFTGQDMARIGHHNDCFLSNTTDQGTYGQDPTADKTYLSQDCLYVPIGGETCPPENNPADGLTAYNTMKQLRFTFLNSDYDTDVINSWTAGGYMDKIKKELGYRFVLSSGDYTTSVAPGGTFTAKIILHNVGFAPLYNERPVELVLKDTTTNKVYKVNLDINPRLWKPIEIQDEIDATVGIPANMPAGDYKLYLNLPDDAETLQNNPNYSVRLANANVWEASTGYNNLLVTINVADNNASTPYSGNLYFSPPAP